MNKTFDGSTPLMWAAGAGQPACLQELIKSGANVNLMNNDGKTPLMCAAGAGQPACLQELIKSGANVNLMNNDGKTPLMCAAGSGQPACLQELIKSGANVNLINKDGKTALMWAAGSGQTVCLQELIKSGADLNSVNYEGSSALIITVERQRETFDHLLKAGANVNIVNSKGDTALTMAAVKANVYMAKHLLRANCRINKMVGMTQNALARHLNRYFQPVDQNLSRLLFAAGEVLDEDNDIGGLAVRELEGVRMQLKHICREAIRKHLLDLDSHQHLFGRIPCCMTNQ